MILMVTLFYLTQKNYSLLNKSNQDVIETASLIKSHEVVANDFKNALLYTSTYKNSPNQAYLDIYGKGLWEIFFDMKRLERLVSKKEKLELEGLLKRITIEEDWLTNTDPNNVKDYEDRSKHIKTIIGIQSFFNSKILNLRQRSVLNTNDSENYLLRLNYWITLLIISTSVIMLVSIVFINKQLKKVKFQNGQLKDIAWIQSHKVRAQVANLMGLSQLFEFDVSAYEENNIIISNLLVTTQKLDNIVREINAKSTLS